MHMPGRFGMLSRSWSLTDRGVGAVLLDMLSSGAYDGIRWVKVLLLTMSLRYD